MVNHTSIRDEFFDLLLGQTVLTIHQILLQSCAALPILIRTATALDLSRKLNEAVRSTNEFRRALIACAQYPTHFAPPFPARSAP